MLSVRLRGGITYLRVHRIFLEAGDKILDEISQFIRKRRGRTPLINEFIRANSEGIKANSKRKLSVNPEGRHYGLKVFFDSINEEYFGGRISASITWGKRTSRSSVRRRTLGSYSFNTNLIRINPLLDNRKVPPYFIGFIVYHEMLHAAVGVGGRPGRRSIHSKEFRRREKLYKDYEKAIAWEKANRI